MTSHEARRSAVQLALGLLLFGSIADSALAEVRTSRTIKQYAIKGTSSDELRAQMSTLGPVDTNDKTKNWALTKWYVRWNYRYSGGTGSCGIASVSTGLSIAYTLPNWENRSQAPESLQGSWDRMMAALKKHEDQHARHGIDAAKEIDAAISNMKARSTCDELGNAANAAAAAIVKKHAQRDVEYDRATNHGRTEIPRLSN